MSQGGSGRFSGDFQETLSTLHCGEQEKDPTFSSEHPKLWGTGKGVPHSALSIPNCGEQEKGPHIQL